MGLLRSTCQMARASPKLGIQAQEEEYNSACTSSTNPYPALSLLPPTNYTFPLTILPSAHLYAAHVEPMCSTEHSFESSTSRAIQAFLSMQFTHHVSQWFLWHVSNILDWCGCCTAINEEQDYAITDKIPENTLQKCAAKQKLIRNVLESCTQVMKGQKQQVREGTACDSWEVYNPILCGSIQKF